MPERDRQAAMSAPKSETRRRSPARAFALWVLVAVLVLGLAAVATPFLAPQFWAASAGAVTDLVEDWIGLGTLVYVGISILSTPIERVVLFAAICAVLTAITFGVPRLVKSRLAGLVQVILAWLFLCAVFVFFRPIDPTYAGIIWDNARAVIPAHVLAVAYAGLLYVMPILLAPLVHRLDGRRTAAGLTAAAAVAGVAALVPHGERMLRASQLVFPEPAVRALATAGRENFHGICLDREHNRLLISGHGTANLLVYDLDDPDRRPWLSPARTGRTQHIGLNPARGEVYAYDRDARELLIIDTETLEQKPSVTDVEIATGDTLVAWDDDRVYISSEGPMLVTGPVPNAFLVVDLKTKSVVSRHAVLSGENLLYDARRHAFIGSHFREEWDVFVYDIARDAFVQRVDMPTQRMTMIGADPVSGDLLLALPLRSQLLRLDPDTLAVKGHIPGPLGVRNFDFDPDRGLLVVMSLLSTLSVLDIKTGERLATYRLPQPWLRNMVLDTQHGKAYVTGRHGVYEVDYASRAGRSKAAAGGDFVPRHCGA